MCVFGAIVRSRCIGPFRPAPGRCPAPLGSRDSGWAVVPPSHGEFAEAPQAVIVHVFEFVPMNARFKFTAVGNLSHRDAVRDAKQCRRRAYREAARAGEGTCRGRWLDLGADEVLRCRLRDLHEFEGSCDGVAAVGLRPADGLC